MRRVCGVHWGRSGGTSCGSRANPGIRNQDNPYTQHATQGTRRVACLRRSQAVVVRRVSLLGGTWWHVAWGIHPGGTLTGLLATEPQRCPLVWVHVRPLNKWAARGARQEPPATSCWTHMERLTGRQKHARSYRPLGFLAPTLHLTCRTATTCTGLGLPLESQGRVVWPAAVTAVSSRGRGWVACTSAGTGPKTGQRCR